jgi:hypothetical protein
MLFPEKRKKKDLCSKTQHDSQNKKNGYFYIIYEICENIDIALYMYMF